MTKDKQIVFETFAGKLSESANEEDFREAMSCAAAGLSTCPCLHSVRANLR